MQKHVKRAFYCDLKKTIKLLLIMKFILLLLIVSVIQANSKAFSQEKINISLKHATIKKVLSTIERTSAYRFIYTDDILPDDVRVDLNTRNATLSQVLNKTFSDTKLIYKILSNNLVAIGTRDQTLAAIPVKGKIIDSAGTSLQGVSVQVKGSTIGTITDANGRFSLEAPNDAVLVISYIGYQTQEVPVNGRAEINIILKQVVSSLNQIVVVGYGTQKKVTVTGSISSIDNKVLLKSPVSNIGNALVGRLPGIIATQPSAEPGYDQSTIRIRGIGTFNGNANPLIMVDGIETENMNDIDPNEIESVTVLKDASATAVYGVRGANGVILITTKRGKEGKPVFSFTANYAVSRFINMREYSGSYDWARGWNEALMYDSYATQTVYKPQWTDDQLALFKSQAQLVLYPNTDWMDLMFKKYSAQSQYNFNVNGGTKRIKYFVSAGIFKQGGLINNKVMNPDYSSQITFDRYNFRSNFDFQVSKRITFKIDLADQVEVKHSPNVGADAGNGTGQLIANTERVPPAMSPGYINGKVVNEYDYFGGNPLVRLLSGVSQQYNNYFTGNLRLNYLLDFITPGLSTHGTISYKDFYSQNLIHGKNVVTYKAILLPDSSINFVPQGLESPFSFGETSTGNNETYAEFGLDYDRAFGNNHFTGLLYYNQQKLIDPNLEYFVPHGYQGLVGRATYDYKSRYLAEFDFGYNGTENFAPGKRFGFFPAYSAGWVISEGPFFPKKNLHVSFLKIRGSYGVVGNDQIGGQRFLYQPTPYLYGQLNNYYYFGLYGIDYNQIMGSSEGHIGNPDLTWERAKKLDIGLDIRLFQDKLAITLDWFKENRNNILTQGNTIPALFGANVPGYNYLSPSTVNALLPPLNVGKMKNSGFDGEIDYNDQIGRFNYWLKANYTYAHNVVIFSDQAPQLYAYEKTDGQMNGQMFGLIAEGYYTTWDEVNNANRPQSNWNNNKLQPGDIRYKDVNGDGIIDNHDAVPVGYPNFPEVIYGISFGGNYAAFDFTVLFQGATDVSLRYSSRTIQGWQNDGGTLSQIIDYSWTQQRYENGDKILYPRPSTMMSSNNAISSTWNIVNASYLRLKQAEIGYSLPLSLINKIGLRKGRIYVNCNNLVTWSKLLSGEDPENPPLGDLETYPLTLTVNAGINIEF